MSFIRKGIDIINRLTVKHLKTFIPWDLWGQGDAVLLLLQVFPDGQQEINNAHFSRESEINIYIISLFT